MEVYQSKFSYSQEADSVLTFNAGETFYILGRPTEKWWFAKRVVDNIFGYVPAAYMEPAKEAVIGKLVPEKRRDTKEHDIHLQALAEIHKKVKPLPAQVIEKVLGVENKPKNSKSKQGPVGCATVLSSRKMVTIEDEADLPQHLLNLNTSVGLEGNHILIPDEDDDHEEVTEIKPRPLINPLSQERQNLHRELKQSGRKVLEQPELNKVFRDRKITEKKKEEERYKESRRTSMEIKLLERQEKLEQEENKLAKNEIEEGDEDALKPEFAKLKLRQTNSSKS